MKKAPTEVHRDRILTALVADTTAYLMAEAQVGRYWEVVSYALNEYNEHTFTLRQYA